MMSVVKDVKKFLNKLNKMKLKNKVLLGVLILVSAIVLHYVYIPFHRIILVLHYLFIMLLILYSLIM